MNIDKYESKITIEEKSFDDTNNKFNPEREYSRAKNIAIRFDIGLSTVWYYAKNGKIKKYKVSSRVTLFDVEEVRRCLIKSA